MPPRVIAVDWSGMNIDAQDGRRPWVHPNNIPAPHGGTDAYNSSSPFTALYPLPRGTISTSRMPRISQFFGITMVRIREVEPLGHFSVRLGFTDGTVKKMDLEPYLQGPVFEPIRNDRELFEAVRVDPELGTIVWPNGADLDPDVLLANGTPSWTERPEDVS